MFAFQPDWSPDGREIAFSGLEPALPGGLYVVNADGTDLTRLTGTTSTTADPAWSPDGQRIAFVDEAGRIEVMNADGSGAATPATTGGVDGGPSWQPLVAQPLPTAVVQQPVNADGSSVFKAGKGVLPVKFTLALDGVPTCTLPPATIALTKLSGATDGAVNESVYAIPADEGSDFRIDDCQYVYNLSLKSLTAGTYRATIAIDGQSVGRATFELR